MVAAPAPAELRLSVSEGEAGTSTVMSGYGFESRESVTVTGPDGTVVRSFTTGSGGSFTRTLTIPAAANPGLSTGEA